MKKINMITAALLLVMGSAQAASSLVVYSAMEDEQLAEYKEAFKKSHPEIELKFIRDSTGVITARLLAEKNNPQADAVWGLYASSLARLAKEGMLEAYAPKDLKTIDASFRDPANPPDWVGNGVESTIICVNTIEMEKQKLPTPATWGDLTNPVYKNKIVMPNPASSGVGYSAVNAWLQMYGKDKGWSYMTALDKNIGQYVHSGSKPCTMVATGEYPIGISLDFRGITLKRQGAPIDIILPKEGMGLDVNAVGIIKGTKNLAAAKALEDFAISQDAFALYQPNSAALARPEMNKPLKELPGEYYQRLLKVNFTQAGAQRAEVLDEWKSKFDAKSAPKT